MARTEWSAGEGRFPILDAFAFPTYRRVWAASFVSQLGDWMQIFGRGVLAYRLTGKAESVGLIYFATYIPQVLVSLWAGVLADRFDRRRILVVALLIQTAGAIAMGTLVMTHTATLAWIALVSFVQGTAAVFMIPAAQALMPSLVPRRAMHSAISFGTATNSVTRVLGPLTAAALVPFVGLEWVFFANALTFVGIMGVWLVTRVPRQPGMEEQRSIDALRHGVRYVRAHPAIWVPMAVSTFLASVGVVYQPLSIVYATEVLAHGDHALGVTRNGWFQAMIGIGSAVGILALASIGRRRPGPTLLWSALTFSVALALLGRTHDYVAALVFALVLGAAQFGNMTLAINLVQHQAPEVMRGRIMSLQMLGLIGFIPFAGIVGGAIADATSVSGLLAVCGLLCAVFSIAAFRWLPHLRSVTLDDTTTDTYAAMSVIEEEG